MILGGSPFCGYPGSQLAAAVAFMSAQARTRRSALVRCCPFAARNHAFEEALGR